MPEDTKCECDYRKWGARGETFPNKYGGELGKKRSEIGKDGIEEEPGV